MSTPLAAPNVVGVAEVARLAGVSKKTVSSWVSRRTQGLPPHMLLASGPVWYRRHIVDWVAARAPVDGCSDCHRLGRNCKR